MFLYRALGQLCIHLGELKCGYHNATTFLYLHVDIPPLLRRIERCRENLDTECLLELGCPGIIIFNGKPLAGDEVDGPGIGHDTKLQIILTGGLNCMKEFNQIVPRTSVGLYPLE